MRLRTLINLVVVALIANASSVISAAPWQDKSAGSQDPISGEWDATFYAMGHATPFSLELKLEGDKVTGKVNSAHTGPGTINKGSWTENKLSLTFDFVTHDAIVVTASLKDGKLFGEFRTEGFVSKWEAKKKAVPVEKSAAESPDLISGEWDATFEAQDRAAPVTFKLKLNGDKVSGTSESAHLGPGTLRNGSWTAGKLSFTIEGASGSIAVTGLLKDGSLVGEFDAGQMHGKWEAKKK